MAYLMFLSEERKSGTGEKVKLPQVEGWGSGEGCHPSSLQPWDRIRVAGCERGVCKASPSGVKMQQLCRRCAANRFALIDEP